ncbi:hypothetical protein Q1J61_11150 [Pseudomonas putida]|uniref:hypothetical protein n=1 Tax=Pseudomonas putida TaxID=303 RepID=UPI0034D593C5
MDHNWGAGRRSGGLDGGYTGSLDHAISNLHVGRSQGRKEGLEEGHKEGFEEGYSQGWYAGAARANEKLEPLRDYVRQYFDEAVQLRAEVERQRELIKLMHGQMLQFAQARRAGAEQGGPQAGLAEEVAALKKANRLLHATIDSMETQFQSTFAQSGLKTQQYNRTLVFAHAAQGLVAELVADGTPEAQAVRERFVEHYRQEVAQSLREGDIQIAPELDEAFQKQLPETHRFIIDMLQSVAPRPEAGEPDPMP